MSVESNVNFVTELNELYPRKNDLIKEGDDHIRLIKKTLKTTFPGFNNAVSMTADKFNSIDDGIVAEAQSFTIKKSIKMNANTSINLSNNKLTGLADPTEDSDAVNLKHIKKIVQESIWPIDSLFFTLSSKDPKDLLGFGVWEKFGSGRSIIGAGTGTDVVGTSVAFALNEVGGNYHQTISKQNLPNYQLGATLSINEVGDHQHTYTQLQISGPSPDTKHGGLIAQYGLTNYTTAPAGRHSHSGSVTVWLGGGGERMSIVQPYVAVNIWKRKS